MTSRICILDTETTGLDASSEIVEISVIDGEMGDVLLDTLIKPTTAIPSGATRVHGITNKMVADAPTWADIHNKVTEILKNRKVFIYNAAYDTKLMKQTAEKYELCMPEINAHCVMLEYAELWGEWNNYRKSYKWQSLNSAMRQQKINCSDLKAHRALADCEMTRRLIQKMREGDLVKLSQV